MVLCIDCKFRERGLWLTPLCTRPTADLAERVCDKERHSSDPKACGQVARFFQPTELAAAEAAVVAWALRPSASWRERQQWTARQHAQFEGYVAAFEKAHSQPTARQRALVDAAYQRFVAGMPGHVAPEHAS
jgi:hypothetical protein